MRYRKLKANQLFDGKRFLEDFVLVVNEAGRIEDLLPAADVTDAENYNGILMPGLINCHCHLELSHLKNSIAPGTGLVPFLLSVIQQRGQQEAGKLAAIAAAEKELYNNGTVAVADICNTTDAIAIKSNSSIYWHSLVELINLRDENRLAALHKCEGVLAQHVAANLSAVLTAHAPYSISTKTFASINEQTAGKIISVHNQESAAENELFQKGTGHFLQLYAAMGTEGLPLRVSGKSSLQTWLPYFTNGQTLLLVHNTFISEADILFAKEHAAQHGLALVYCLCPNANLYIENKLPPVHLLIKHGCHIVLGTDSYSSNWQLSIGAEIKTLQQHFGLSLEVLLGWATASGAAALGFDHLGHFTKGTQPGVILMNENDFTTSRIL